jgi:hypothetical protein
VQKKGINIMDKTSKKVLNHLISNGGCDKYIYWGEDFDTLVQTLNLNSEDLRADIRYLHDCGYIDYQKFSNSDRNASFSLSHKGLHWKYFRRQAILQYILEKWIDFFAMLVSFISLAIAIISLLLQLSPKL